MGLVEEELCSGEHVSVHLLVLPSLSLMPCRWGPGSKAHKVFVPDTSLEGLVQRLHFRDEDSEPREVKSHV